MIQIFTTWRERSLQTRWRVLYLDGVHFSIRYGDKADVTIILTALGVDLNGNKEVLALQACSEMIDLCSTSLSYITTGMAFK